MSATPFQSDGSLDEEGLRSHIRRLVAARQGVYLGSGGAGEGHTLTVAELRRVYDIGVAEAKGKVPVCANPRESRSAAAMFEVAHQAIEAGVDLVQIYQLDAGHGMIPTQREQEAYFGELLSALNHPIAISIHALAGYRATSAFLADLCGRYQQIVAVNVMHPSNAYFVELRDALPPRVKLYTMVTNLVQVLSLGAAGALLAESNILPNICQDLADAYEKGDMSRLSTTMMTIQRFDNIVDRWMPSTARWVKMAMKVLGLGNGVLRLPYLLPPDEDLRRMADAFAALRIAELEGLSGARRASAQGVA
jgi:4-hydroxy-tetrahydrodipicolinate synthase